MHNSLTVVAVWVLWRGRERWQLNLGDEAGALAFLAVHSLAAHWLYSNVPYDRWWQQVFGVSLNAAMGWQRNHFDRLVHFLYGVCLTPALAAWARTTWRVSVPHGRVLALGLVIVTGVVYEWMEWGVAMALSPEAAEAYNGQQGDMWDAHMDMLLAALGSVLTLALVRSRPPAGPGIHRAS